MVKSKKFPNQVLAKTSKIPAGKVTTYKLLAQAVGRPKAFRAVGNVLNKNQKLIKIPCHRVVKSDGRLGGYRSGKKKKLILLKKEGIEFKGRKINSLKRFLYKF